MPDIPFLVSHPLLQAPRYEVEAILVQHGYRLTKPRAAVVEAVLRHTRPLTAEQLVVGAGTPLMGASDAQDLDRHDPVDIAATARIPWHDQARFRQTDCAH